MTDNSNVLFPFEEIRTMLHGMKNVIDDLQTKQTECVADAVGKVATGTGLSPERETAGLCVHESEQKTFFQFMKDAITQQRQLGRIRTSETYTSALNSFRRFWLSRKADENVAVLNDIFLDDVDSDIMMAYEAYLKSNGVSPNSSSFYMRNLRAVYNRAVESRLTAQQYPFKHVYTGVGKTVKRAVSLQTIRQIKSIDLSMHPLQSFARDMFLFSFYTRGMSFIDMAYLRKSDLNDGILSYRRRKTGQRLLVRWEACMQDIVDKYVGRTQSDYLLPIIDQNKSRDRRQQYIYMRHKVNHNLKAIGVRLHLSLPLTMYVARHSWASIAQSKRIPVSVIQESMGHDSERTTRIYLASLDNMAVDQANRLILASLGK